MNPTSSQLQIPDRTTNDPKAFEIVRVWVAHGEQHVAIRVGAWKKPEAWGIVLADLAMHLAQAYEQHAGLNRDITLEQIKTEFAAKLKSATDDPIGYLM
jgi:hypothetical protein